MFSSDIFSLVLAHGFLSYAQICAYTKRSDLYAYVKNTAQTWAELCIECACANCAKVSFIMSIRGPGNLKGRATFSPLFILKYHTLRRKIYKYTIYHNIILLYVCNNHPRWPHHRSPLTPHITPTTPTNITPYIRDPSTTLVLCMWQAIGGRMVRSSNARLWSREGLK